MGTPEVRDVPLDEAFREARDLDQVGGNEEAPPTPRPAPQISQEEQQQEEEQSERLKEDLELLAPKIAPRQWEFGPEDMRKTYIQYELSVTGSARWFGLVGEVLQEALSGDHALSLNSLLQAPAPR